ncbi:hypothetical protein LTR20_009292 [Exophiala xenobiotica]|nr:hypothetical protein LTR40_005776 [Exophiala xenobiotica]KAK5361712.1 hypothetical protein LTS13_009713 [Exophiala xenobiotica]KAK5408240.1 hypothetical protein LTR90_009696 [Exophiala xenobiotica]KAK5456351.1 hypothetical protein LTR20_009292 [Exophiala xenobiotica]KAK5472253.1 hypothetical protein LTR26_010379 [Exophiala xenobiotica]
MTGHSGLKVKGHTSTKNILIICVATLASFNYGYSNNVISGSFAQVSFLAKFLSGPDAASITDAIVSGFFGCALIGAFLQAWIAQAWGRKSATAVAAVFLLTGNAIQAGAVHIAMFLVGRYLAGFGAGMVISNTPVYLSEIAPAHSRGLLVGLQGNFIVFGYILSSSAALGFHFVKTSYQWRLNFVIATSVAVALLVSLISLPESPRWLIEHGRPQEARKILDSIHTTRDDPEGKIAHAEYHQIVAQVEVDRSLPSGWLHIVKLPSLRKRMICTLLVWSMGQSTGITVLANLTPPSLGVLAIPLCYSLFSVWIPLIVAGGFGSAALLAVEAALQAEYLDGHNLSGTKGAVAIYFIIAWFYTCTLECTGYVYGCEIWPTHLRSKGAAISYFGFYICSIWATAPAAQAFKAIGWKYYMVFIAVTVVLTIPCMFYLPETAGLSLEDLGAKFGDTVALDFEHALEEELKGAGVMHAETDITEVNDEGKRC